MQLTNSATIVDFFPEAFVAEACEKKGVKVVIKRFNKRVTFRANGMKSYSTVVGTCLLYTSPSPRDQRGSRMPSSA